MMMRLTLLFGALAALAWLPTAALADWADDFDSYENGSSMHGQGGWEGWEGDPTWDAYVTNAQARSEPHSVDIVGDADLVHPFEGYTEGQWTLTAHVYVPSDLVAPNDTYFILLNTYGAGEHNWSTQVHFNPDTNTIIADFDHEHLPIVYDAWMELRVEIDLDADWQDIYYGGDLLVGKSWTDGLSGDGALNIGALDLFAWGASSVYYDDMSLVPLIECPGDIDGDGDTDHSDLGALLSAWCSSPGDPNWNPNADLDGDGHVGHGDLGILLADWGCGT